MKTSQSRRLFLRGTGVALALPLLEQFAFRKPLLSAEEKKAEPPRRMLCINTTLGIHTENLFPKQTGKDYENSPYLEVIKQFRDDFTVFSGLSHPDVDGGHSAEASYLTAAPHPRADSFKNTISLDQFAVERLAPDTRFASLCLSSSSSRGLSYTRSGVAIPAQERPSAVFKKMFVEGTPAQVRTQVERLSQGESIMDTIHSEAKSLERDLGKRDREKLAEYFSAVREVEQRLQKAQSWAKLPKPVVNAKVPADIADGKEVAARVRLMTDLMHLAFQTDSTRFITFAFSGMNAVPKIEGVSQDWHNLSHHGQDPAKLAELKIIELEQFKLFGELLAKLKSTNENGRSLLDQTIVMFGSNLGNASSHSNSNMPIVVAGGGFRHGQHLAFDPKKNPPLSNLYVQFLQRLGLDIDTFGSSTGTMPGFSLA
ncbi:DUF1552 domain-containing protein [Anatilimnocola floriformis]|uniref:DUF1552 domain-containing protein n=1 Tax=Anatilimnocola floriformis TaxID=2948575 RepID=UPI0020C4445A|nr:DUF1552 domain-containing protein [Anatilimnocola floriformis]